MLLDSSYEIVMQGGTQAKPVTSFAGALFGRPGCPIKCNYLIGWPVGISFPLNKCKVIADCRGW